MAKEVEGDDEDGEDTKPKKVRPEFDFVEFKHEFDMANPSIEIPPEVRDDIDNDYDLPYKPPTTEKDWMIILGHFPLFYSKITVIFH